MHTSVCNLVVGASLVLAFTPSWPFNWSTIQPQAFPGSRNRFMLPSELESLARFSMLNVWGLNATCIEWNGSSPYPASCGDGGCSCVAPTPEEQRWVPNMNTSLQAQAVALKAATPGGRFLPVVGYMDWPTAQQYFGDQNMLCVDEQFATWRLSVASKGVIDCFKDNCNHQGMEWCQPDFRNSEARAWWVNTVLSDIIAAPGNDGTFMDECDQFFSMCSSWPCSENELWAIGNGTLASLDAALALAASLNKWLVVSITATRTGHADFHASVVDMLLKHESGFRYYEFFGSVDQMLTMAEEVAAGIPVQVLIDCGREYFHV
jgi:hypothetical protein